MGKKEEHAREEEAKDLPAEGPYGGWCENKACFLAYEQSVG